MRGILDAEGSAMQQGICRRIREARLEKGLSLEGLQRLTGISIARISVLDRAGDPSQEARLGGKGNSTYRSIGSVELHLLGDALGAEPGWLLTGRSSMEATVAIPEAESRTPVPEPTLPEVRFGSLGEFRDLASPETPSNSRFWRTMGAKWEAATTQVEKDKVLEEVSRITNSELDQAVKRMCQELAFEAK